MASKKGLVHANYPELSRAAAELAGFLPHPEQLGASLVSRVIVPSRSEFYEILAAELSRLDESIVNKDLLAAEVLASSPYACACVLRANARCECADQQLSRYVRGSTRHMNTLLPREAPILQQGLPFLLADEWLTVFGLLDPEDRARLALSCRALFLLRRRSARIGNVSLTAHQAVVLSQIRASKKAQIKVRTARGWGATTVALCFAITESGDYAVLVRAGQLNAAVERFKQLLYYQDVVERKEEGVLFHFKNRTIVITDRPSVCLRLNTVGLHLTDEEVRAALLDTSKPDQPLISSLGSGKLLHLTSNPDSTTNMSLKYLAAQEAPVSFLRGLKSHWDRYMNVLSEVYIAKKHTEGLPGSWTLFVQKESIISPSALSRLRNNKKHLFVHGKKVAVSELAKVYSRGCRYRIVSYEDSFVDNQDAEGFIFLDVLRASMKNLRKAALTITARASPVKSSQVLFVLPEYQDARIQLKCAMALVTKWNTSFLRAGNDYNCLHISPGCLNILQAAYDDSIKLSIGELAILFLLERREYSSVSEQTLPGFQKLGIQESWQELLSDKRHRTEVQDLHSPKWLSAKKFQKLIGYQLEEFVYRH